VSKGGADKGLNNHQNFDLKRGASHPERAAKKLRPKDRPLVNDFISDEDFDQILLDWFGNASRVLKPGGSFYIWGGYANLGNYPGPLKASGFYFSQGIIWDKQHPVLTRKDMMGAFEICFYGWKEGAGHHFYGPNNATDLWHVKKVNPQTIDMFKYAAWLTLEFFKNDSSADGFDYDKHKRRTTENYADAVRSAQDIGELPAVVNPERRGEAEANFKNFCETYFSEVFYLPWSPDHDKVIKKIERAVLNGGLFAVAMPRGSGKTVLMQMACLWSALIGATPFVTLIAASADRAKDLLENIKIWLETNPPLAEDFPEVCFPIRALERIANRQKGQKYQGSPTRIEWASDKIVLPTIPESKASGVVISCSGMKGSDIRGQNHARADGKVVRPALVMVDDPQTTESAWSSVRPTSFI
jgi:hypothetical protein